MGKRAVTGERPPAYVSKATLAAELDMSESTVDSYVQRGLLPKPLKYGSSVRWKWADVTAFLDNQSHGAEDPFMARLHNV